MSTVGLTPKDNELRMQVGFRLSHTTEHQLYVADADGNWMCPMEALKELLALVRADEREACAKLCEDNANDSDMSGAYWCADAIRARGDK